MTQARKDVEGTIRAFIDRIGKPVDVLGDELPLYADGIGLDSLETAELSALLEDAYGADPFQAGPMPQTVGDIVGFYDRADAPA